MRAEHFYKQFQQANQRHILLIDELEHNQLSIEQAYERRFRLVSLEKYDTINQILLTVSAVLLDDVVLFFDLPLSLKMLGILYRTFHENLIYVLQFEAFVDLSVTLLSKVVVCEKLCCVNYRSFDERYRTKLSQMEERFSLEKKDLLAELEKVILKKVFYIGIKFLNVSNLIKLTQHFQRKLF